MTNPKLAAGRDRGGNPFSIANALKPSRATVTLTVIDGSKSPESPEALRAQAEAYRRDLDRVTRQLDAQALRLARLAARSHETAKLTTAQARTIRDLRRRLGLPERDDLA